MSSQESLRLLKLLNTTSSVFNTYGASGSATYLPRIGSNASVSSPGQKRISSGAMFSSPGLKKSYSWTNPPKNLPDNSWRKDSGAAKLYKTTTQQLGHFYGTASGMLLTPNAREMKCSAFTSSFKNSGMYSDTSLNSPNVQKLRRKYHREYVKKRAIEKEAFELRQRVAIEEKKERRAMEREKRHQRYMRRQNSATLIQCMARSRVARTRTMFLRQKAQHVAAARMQAMWKNMRACKGPIMEKINRRRRKAATRLQAAARRRQAKRVVDEKFVQRDLERTLLLEKYRNDQATNIQRVYRGFRDRQQVNRKLAQRAKMKNMNKKRGRKKKR
jgi:hypothetical protein|eukprot:g292.t1